MILMVNWINATGEYTLGSIVKKRAATWSRPAPRRD